ncbi:MAG: DUF1553 domain-containing protein [Proteobacteria bacterium]|nr:DUF1553 domain-containing protein [Pseudomonadota bacterium]
MVPGLRLTLCLLAAMVHGVTVGQAAALGAGAATNAAPPQTHWSFQPVRKPAVPAVKDARWVQSPVDAFILAKLEARKWQPATPARPADWLRRVYFDLTGLPPTPEEVAAFVADTSPKAREAVVDRLLASERYGERWAQHWLDVVRFAESEGFEYDRPVPDAWRFRDYVVASLNADKPFDRFITEQLAGDELDPENRDYQAASIFHRLGAVRRNAGNAEIALSRNEVLTERTDIIGTAFLGLTVGCARCHDHKLDPIAQKDYYRLQAYFAATEEHNLVLATAEEKQAWDARTKAGQAEIAAVKEKARQATGAEKERLNAQLEALEAKLPAPLATIAGTWNDPKKRTLITVLRRGVWEQKGEPVGPRPPEVLIADARPELPADVANPRTQLARWITDPWNPLTARVLANRIWQHHFGAGLVKTPNDFGLHGDRPSHPELLDWLATALVEGGWRLKPVHRMLVLSATYQQASEVEGRGSRVESPRLRPALDLRPSTLDPDNRLLSHFNRRRLSAEEIRDAMLAVSGRLKLRTGGPSVMVPVDAELVKLLYKPTQWQPTADVTEHNRRSLYLFAKRNLRLPFMEAFDAPALQTTCARRESSTHAPQALELLNGRLANELAAAFAQRLETEGGGDSQRVVERAFQLATGRAPTESERTLALAFLREQPLREFALATFSLNAFLYVP